MWNEIFEQNACTSSLLGQRVSPLVPGNILVTGNPGEDDGLTFGFKFKQNALDSEDSDVR